MNRIKYVPYHQTGDGFISQVAYLVFGNKCVFTAAQKSCFGSTINFAEAIVDAIAKNEHVSSQSFRFFDLQTVASYGSRLWGVTEERDIGFFEMDEVHLGDRTDLPHWVPTVCPKHVSDTFTIQIGRIPKQYFPGSEAAAQKIDFPAK